MNGSCGHEARVIAAVIAGDVTTEVREHMSACNDCAEVATLAGLLTEQSYSSDLEETPLPDPANIWWKAQLRARRTALERATLPIRVVQAIAMTALAVVIVWAISASEWQGWIAGQIGGSAETLATAAIAAAGAIVACLYVGLADNPHRQSYSDRAAPRQPKLR